MPAPSGTDVREVGVDDLKLRECGTEEPLTQTVLHLVASGMPSF
jgi:hypothetical protein